MNHLKGNKFTVITLLATIIIIIGGVLLFSNSSKDASEPTPNIPSDSYVYFYGQGCTHCKNVEEFMNSWEKKDSINLTKLEVWYNKNNANIFASEAEKCGVSKNDLAVPFLVTPDGKCMMGDTPIIDHFKNLQ